jgi:hypothetical protein
VAVVVAIAMVVAVVVAVSVAAMVALVTVTVAVVLAEVTVRVTDVARLQVAADVLATNRFTLGSLRLRPGGFLWLLALCNNVR